MIGTLFQLSFVLQRFLHVMKSDLGGTAIFIFLEEIFFWTSNEESQLRKEDEQSTARITILYVCIRIYMLNYVYGVFGLYILVYRWEGFGRICIVLY